jgi:hypothetical protein
MARSAARPLKLARSPACRDGDDRDADEPCYDAGKALHAGDRDDDAGFLDPSNSRTA